MKDIDNFVEEITTNFSELFVETFFLRYLSDYDERDLLETANEIQNILIKKIKNQMLNKLKKLGYKDKNIKAVLK